MTLIVEDGTIVAGANTYVSLATARAYAEARGRIIPDDDDLLSAYIIRSTDYLESFRAQYKGTLMSDTQLLSFPRHGVTIGSYTYADNAIPTLLIAAQSQLVIDISNGLDLQPSFERSEPQLKRKRIGPLEKEWFEGGFLSPQLTAVWSILSPLLNDAQDIRRTLRI